MDSLTLNFMMELERVVRKIDQKDNPMSKRIIIAGSGFAGLWAALAAKSNPFSITRTKTLK